MNVSVRVLREDEIPITDGKVSFSVNGHVKEVALNKEGFAVLDVKSFVNLGEQELIMQYTQESTGKTISKKVMVYVSSLEIPLSVEMEHEFLPPKDVDFKIKSVADVMINVECNSFKKSYTTDKKGEAVGKVPTSLFAENRGKFELKLIFKGNKIYGPKTIVDNFNYRAETILHADFPQRDTVRLKLQYVLNREEPIHYEPVPQGIVRFGKEGEAEIEVLTTKGGYYDKFETPFEKGDVVIVHYDSMDSPTEENFMFAPSKTTVTID